MNNTSGLSTSEYELHKEEYDAATFTNEPFAEVEDVIWGKKVTWTPDGLAYKGAEYQISEGQQVEETISDRFRIFVFREGSAKISLEDSQGVMQESDMEYGKGFRVQSGQKFAIRVVGATKIIEGSEVDASEAVEKELFTTESYVGMDNSKPWGWEHIFAKKEDPIAMKILHIEEGECLSLQAHEKKIESYYMSYGRCDMIMESTNRELIEFVLEYEKGYTTKVGQRHRHQGGTKMDVFEVSTKEDGSTTWRLADKYARGDQTDAVRVAERGNI